MSELLLLGAGFVLGMVTMWVITKLRRDLEWRPPVRLPGRRNTLVWLAGITLLLVLGGSGHSAWKLDRQDGNIKDALDQSECLTAHIISVEATIDRRDTGRQLARERLLVSFLPDDQKTPEQRLLAPLSTVEYVAEDFAVAERNPLPELRCKR